MRPIFPSGSIEFRHCEFCGRFIPKFRSLAFGKLATRCACRFRVAARALRAAPIAIFLKKPNARGYVRSHRAAPDSGTSRVFNRRMPIETPLNNPATLPVYFRWPSPQGEKKSNMKIWPRFSIGARCSVWSRRHWSTSNSSAFLPVT